MTFAQRMAENADSDVKWDAETLFSERGPETKIRYHVPTSQTLGKSWTKLNFNDAP